MTSDYQGEGLRSFTLDDQIQDETPVGRQVAALPAAHLGLVGARGGCAFPRSPTRSPRAL